MRAYLKFAVILSLAFAVDRVVFAPARLARALCDEAQHDWPRCIVEVLARVEELNSSCAGATATARPDLIELWRAAEQDHVRHCRRSHLAYALTRPVPATPRDSGWLAFFRAAERRSEPETS